jgi:hypothetical protein
MEPTWVVIITVVLHCYRAYLFNNYHTCFFRPGKDGTTSSVFVFGKGFLDRIDDLFWMLPFSSDMQAARPNVFVKKTASPKTCGMLAALPSGLIIVFQLQGASSSHLGRNGSKACAVQHLRQVLLRLWFWMDRCNTMKQMIELRNMSASWVARLAGPAARSGLAARLRAAGNQPALWRRFLPISWRQLSCGGWLKQMPAEFSRQSGSKTKIRNNQQ